MLIEQLHPDWMKLLQNQLPFLQRIEAKIRGGETTVPESSNILRALSWSPRQQSVLLLGQDPYPSHEHAMGLCFAVPAGTHPLPGSLRNILRELESDLAISVKSSPDISIWAQRGVLMLNRHLTTKPGVSAAHSHLDWPSFTDIVISEWSRVRGGSGVAILWGREARLSVRLLGQVSIIESVHPSPLSAHRGFFGSRPFSRCNNVLASMQLAEIDWTP